MIITFLLRLCAIIGICKIDDNNVKETCPNLLNLNSFGSKTAYRNSKLHELKDESNYNYLANCDLVQVNAIFRHGTRFPSLKDMNNMETVHRKIMKSHANSILPVTFQNWELPFAKNKEKELASVGYEEMMILGNRFRSYFNKYMTSSKINPKQIEVYSSSISRSKISALTFIRFFLNETKTLKEVTKMIQENDHYLRFFDNCPHYSNTVLKNKGAKMEFSRFKNGPEIKQIIKEIQQKWKITDVILTPDDIHVLYLMCGFEIATNLSSSMKPHVCPLSPADDGLVVCPLNHKFAPRETSPLCSLLDSDHYVTLEYINDLKHYWVKAYGKEINWLQSCAIMSPILDQIMSAARGHQSAFKIASTNKQQLDDLLADQTYNRGVFWFGHAETLLPLITLLGLFNQTTPVTSKTFAERLNLMNDKNQRFSTFRTSNIVPFAGNLALELYHCPKLAQDNLSGYRVQVRVNEKPVAWPIANSLSHVSLEIFMKHLNLCLSDKYDHNAVCVLGMSANKLKEVRKRSDELSAFPKFGISTDHFFIKNATADPKK